MEGCGMWQGRHEKEREPRTSIPWSLTRFGAGREVRGVSQREEDGNARSSQLPFAMGLKEAIDKTSTLDEGDNVGTID